MVRSSYFIISGLWQFVMNSTMSHLLEIHNCALNFPELYFFPRIFRFIVWLACLFFALPTFIRPFTKFSIVCYEKLSLVDIVLFGFESDEAAIVINDTPIIVQGLSV